MCQRKKYSLSIASHPEPRKTKRRQNQQSLSNAPRNIDGDVTSTTNMAASSPTSKQTLATPLHHFPDARFWPTNSSVDASAFISIDPGKLPRSRLLESQPTNACALANKAAQYHAKAQLMGMFPNHSFSVYQSTRSCRSRTSSGQAARPTRPRLCQRPTVLK